MTVEGDNAIALVSRQSFESRCRSKPCFSRRPEIRLCCSDIELEQVTCLQPQTETESGHFACQDISLSQIFNLVFSASEKMFDSMWENSPPPVVRRGSKTSLA